jgi:HNH endonuclease
MKRSLDGLVWQRSRAACEYCRMPEERDEAQFQIDHVIAKVHGGKTRSDNLALACFFCNNRKGTNLSGIDSESGEIMRLFNPRRDRWNRHFRWDGPMLLGRTRTGRATITVLEINLPDRVALRALLIEEGVFPPF